MNLVRFALRRPLTVMVIILAMALGSLLAVAPSVCQQFGIPYPDGLPKGMDVDIFPSLNLPVIYVCQPYGGMDPAQMEGFLTNYYEYHFLYISGIHHVESRNVQGMALMKLYFHPGTDMAQAMAETINYVNRARAFMPPGTVTPFVMRFDTGSVPVGYLVLSSETRSIAEIEDLALFRIRPMFSSLPGVSAPPPFGGSARTIVVTLDPERLQSYAMSPEEVVKALVRSNSISPSGNVPIGDKYPIVPVNSVVRDPKKLETVPIRLGSQPVYVRDVGYVTDSADAPTGYALANGRRAVYILATKRSDASTLSVINEIKKALPKMKDALGKEGEGIDVRFEFDQSPYVTHAVTGVVVEGFFGAGLIGLMVLLFLRDWRSVLVVILNIPLALMASVLALWITGQTVNLMTLGGLALAIGILVDEATVEIENIHAHFRRGEEPARAALNGAAETNLPRFLAMLCILAVFVSSFFMQGAARALFVPMSLAVSFAMVASYLLSSTFVPVMCVWLLKGETHHADHVRGNGPTMFERLRLRYERILPRVIGWRWMLVGGYVAGSVIVLVAAGFFLGRGIFPTVDAGQFRLRMRAADGTNIGRTEQLAKKALGIVADELGPHSVQRSLGYVGMIHSNFPINAVYQWSRGPEEAILYVAFDKRLGLSDEKLKERLRVRLAREMPDVRFSFEPSDIVNDVMSFGSPTPVEIAVSGPNFADDRAFSAKLMGELAKIPSLRDLQYGQSLDYPTIQVNVDREKAGLSGLVPSDVSKALVTATSSSRFTVPNYWADPKSGIAYQVQVEIPRPVVRSPDGIMTIKSANDLARIPLKATPTGEIHVGDISDIHSGTMPGQYDRYNMKRQITLAANIAGSDLGSVSQQVSRAISRAGAPPRGVQVETRGQIPPMRQMESGLAVGLALAVIAVFLLLTANFQSMRLAFVTITTVPAVVAGVAVMLLVTGTQLNIQSFIGSIMAVGVAMANAILLVTFAEHRRREGMSSSDAAASGATSRLRAILMTSCAMVAGMLPMALGFGESGQQNAPLGRAVIGGLVAATVATLLILPTFFAMVQERASRQSSSLHPDDMGEAEQQLVGGTN
ncbi:MAG TPA: efflux RND transporter permease subunit [Lacipirellulaceae bacterium]|nr:efflux RND transporter permease subunit [Lacipirellulaceae bacterium]